MPTIACVDPKTHVGGSTEKFRRSRRAARCHRRELHQENRRAYDKHASGRSHQPFDMPGQYRDDETGLSYNWHRYYDGGLGRFLATDSANQFGGALSSYTYAAGWVPNAYDPDGRFVFLAPGAVAVAPYVIGGVAALALFLKPDRVPQPGPTAGPPKKPSPGPDPAPDPAPDPDPSPGPKRIPTPDNRQFCIDMYVLCQNQGWTGSCFACMETCTGSDGNWPFAQCHPRKNACE